MKAKQKIILAAVVAFAAMLLLSAGAAFWLMNRMHVRERWRGELVSFEEGQLCGLADAERRGQSLPETQLSVLRGEPPDSWITSISSLGVTALVEADFCRIHPSQLGRTVVVEGRRTALETVAPGRPMSNLSAFTDVDLVEPDP